MGKCYLALPVLAMVLVQSLCQDAPVDCQQGVSNNRTARELGVCTLLLGDISDSGFCASAYVHFPEVFLRLCVCSNHSLPVTPIPPVSPSGVLCNPLITSLLSVRLCLSLYPLQPFECNCTNVRKKRETSPAITSPTMAACTPLKPPMFVYDYGLNFTNALAPLADPYPFPIYGPPSALGYFYLKQRPITQFAGYLDKFGPILTTDSMTYYILCSDLGCAPTLIINSTNGQYFHRLYKGFSEDSLLLLSAKPPVHYKIRPTIPNTIKPVSRYSGPTPYNLLKPEKVSRARERKKRQIVTNVNTKTSVHVLARRSPHPETLSVIIEKYKFVSTDQDFAALKSSLDAFQQSLIINWNVWDVNGVLDCSRYNKSCTIDISMPYTLDWAGWKWNQSCNPYYLKGLLDFHPESGTIFYTNALDPSQLSGCNLPVGSRVTIVPPLPAMQCITRSKAAHAIIQGLDDSMPDGFKLSQFFYDPPVNTTDRAKRALVCGGAAVGVVVAGVVTYCDTYSTGDIDAKIEDAYNKLAGEIDDVRSDLVKTTESTQALITTLAENVDSQLIATNKTIIGLTPSPKQLYLEQVLGMAYLYEIRNTLLDMAGLALAKSAAIGLNPVPPDLIPKTVRRRTANKDRWAGGTYVYFDEQGLPNMIDYSIQGTNTSATMLTLTPLSPGCDSEGCFINPPVRLIHDGNYAYLGLLGDSLRSPLWLDDPLNYPVRYTKVAFPGLPTAEGVYFIPRTSISQEVTVPQLNVLGSTCYATCIGQDNCTTSSGMLDRGEINNACTMEGNTIIPQLDIRSETVIGNNPFLAQYLSKDYITTTGADKGTLFDNNLKQKFKDLNDTLNSYRDKKVEPYSSPSGVGNSSTYGTFVALIIFLFILYIIVALLICYLVWQVFRERQRKMDHLEEEIRSQARPPPAANRATSTLERVPPKTVIDG